MNKHWPHSCEIFIFHCSTSSDLIYMSWPERFMKMTWRYSCSSSVTNDFFCVCLCWFNRINLLAGVFPAVIYLQAGSRLCHFNELIHLSRKRVPEWKFLNELLIGVPGRWWQPPGRWGISERVAQAPGRGFGSDPKVIMGQTCPMTHDKWWRSEPHGPGLKGHSCDG